MSAEKKLSLALEQVEKETTCPEERKHVQDFKKKLDDSWKTQLVVKAATKAAQKAEDHEALMDLALNDIEKETTCPEEKAKIQAFRIEKDTQEGEEFPWFKVGKWVFRGGKSIWDNFM